MTENMFSRSNRPSLAAGLLLVLLAGSHVAAAHAKHLISLRGLKQALLDSGSEEQGATDVADTPDNVNSDDGMIDQTSVPGDLSPLPSTQPAALYPNAIDVSRAPPPPVYPTATGNPPPVPIYGPAYGGAAPDKSAWDQVFDLVKSVAADAGMSKTVVFFQDVVPVMGPILNDLPHAVLYLRRLFKYGMPYSFQSADSSVAGALHRIVVPTLGSLLGTDTGSFIADQMLTEQGVDLSAAAAAESWRDLVPLLNTGVWTELGQDYGPTDVALSTLNILKGLAVYTLSPYGRLSPSRVAADTVSVCRALVDNVVAQAPVLRDEADRAKYMEDREWSAFVRLQDNLEVIQHALAKLDGN